MSDSPTRPIDRCVDAWHTFMTGGSDPDVLAELLHDDCVFVSPVVFTPQQGKDITAMYLTAASGSLEGSDGPTEAPPVTSPSGAEWDGRFRYVRELRDGDHAVLEFETTVDGKYVNGIDMITCDDEGRIVEFKVMIRPLQAINAVHAQMKAALARLSNAGA